MQDAFAIVIVAVAVAFLARRTWLNFAGRTGRGCGSCGNCGTANPPSEKPLLRLEQLTFSADRPSSRQP